MIRFNESNITVGFIKELLHSFNLPKAKPFLDDNLVYDKELLIKNNFIAQADRKGNANPTYTNLFPFVYNKFEANYTTNLEIRNQLYDSETHEYLGEYLRFIRDYKKLNLMSMYNCFSDRLLDNTKIVVQDNDKGINIDFETNNNYKVYIVPVKLNQSYTIALTSDLPIEVFCGLFGKDYIPYLVDKKAQTPNYSFEQLTYLEVKDCNFNNPFIYNRLADLSTLPESIKLFYQQHEESLKLFLKIPFNANTSITILEGIYKNVNDKSFRIASSANSDDSVYESFDIVKNSSTINFEENAQENVPLISSKQLLTLNSKTSHPFADKLLEYLCDNAITNIEDISDNIKRVQAALLDRQYNGKLGLNTLKDYSGVWTDTYKNVLYEIAQKEKILNTTDDILGYVDKDIEKILLANEVDIYKN